MKSIFAFLIIILTSLPLMVSEAKANVTCPSRPAGAVNIIWSSDKIEYDFSKSQSQMNSMENDTYSPYGNSKNVHVGGLMRGGVGIQSQVQVATLTYPRTNEMCQWIEKVDIKVKIDPKIYISREHKRGSCRHNAIMEHEMKHIFVDREIVKKYIPILKQRLQKAVLDIGIVGPKHINDQVKYQNKINAYIEKEIKTINARLDAERRQRQQAVDSLQEYERVAAMCKD